MTPMRVVTPFRPFAAESKEHIELGPFDWYGAIDMLRASVHRACHCETYTITDVDTYPTGPKFQYETRERRLMLWILEVSLCYLAGPDFDCDTVMCSPDQLVFQDLRPWFAGDIGIVMRPQHKVRPILNALQWWPLQSRDRLVAFYERALAIAKTLPEDLIVWGADSEPLRRLLKPVRTGIGPRKCGLIANMVDSRDVMTPMTAEMIDALKQGRPITVQRAVVDFRYLRKRYMRAFFDATIGAGVTV